MSGFCMQDTGSALGGDKDAVPRTDSVAGRASIPSGSCQDKQMLPKMQG